MQNRRSQLHIRLTFQKELNNACVIDEVNYTFD